MRFAYANRGASLLRWNGRTAPSQSRAGETASLGEFNVDVPRAGAPEVVSGYESPAPGAAVVHLGSTLQRYGRRRASSRLNAASISCCENCSCGGGDPCCSDMATSRSLSGFIPEGTARAYGQQMLADDAPTPLLESPMVRRAAMIAAAYHGAKRHGGSVMWGLLWAMGAYVAPINGLSAVALATAQGFGEKK